MCLPERACPAAYQWGQEPLEESCRFVERLLQSIVQMHVELLGLVDIFTDASEYDGFEESLGDVRLGRNENPGCFITGVGCPCLGSCYGKKVFPLW